ncbi:hypothetical protein BZ973_00350 [Salmonella enterica subsp. enterica serovar Enteritidis]|uniref:Uncharacterized protein n=1 Tax=Salmonella enteritidis TaxID=149539 RepID=A0A5W4PV75_SALEN|nr:hypothetical protein [Salmonella enterica subsp. enterica serovar Javiana]EBW9113621.1 hypothetical protein [Salmonella enterica subsp. enterica serovar Enteritidis]EBY3091934.1 hypothetical protein [Salmonella enterica subsp. enterica serovar Typhimurium]ECV8078979.1 hypothetical protein [Salmonella enterica subsp. enterica serovar Infantis]EED6472064.1 hypothetical protein [Salmonella enterica subsp. enterica serovar Derby]ELV6861724.1 macro domain-containing protein [Salmonella enterica]
MSLELIDEAIISHDLFNAPERFKVVTVNCVGAMGRGIALACRERFPSLYNDYRQKCRKEQIVIGEVYCYPEEGVILLPTKTHFRYKSQIYYVTSGIDALARLGEDLEGGIAIPPLGMANGWLRYHERLEIFIHLQKRLQHTEQTYRFYLPDTLLREAEKIIPNSFK